MPSFAHQQTVQTANAPISSTVTVTGDTGLSGTYACPDGDVTEIDVSIDVSAVKGFCLQSNKAVTVKTNDPDTPDDTIALAANIPYIWTTSSADAFALGTDVTSLHVDNSSGAAATLRFETVVDGTP